MHNNLRFFCYYMSYEYEINAFILLIYYYIKLREFQLLIFLLQRAYVRNTLEGVSLQRPTTLI